MDTSENDDKRRDDMDIICITNKTVCEEVLKSFLKLFEKEYLKRNIQKLDTERLVLTKSSILIFYKSEQFPEEIYKTLHDMSDETKEGETIMIILISDERTKGVSSTPYFMMNSRIRMWALIDSSRDRTEENINANCVLDCFLRISQKPDKEMMVLDKSKTLLPHKDEERPIQLLEKGSENVNAKIKMGNDTIHILCCKNAEKPFQCLSRLLRSKKEISARLIEQSDVIKLRGSLLFAMCLQYDDTDKDIQKLESLIGGCQATLIIINACERNVSLQPTKPVVNTNIFPHIINFRYSDTSNEIYECPENKKGVKLLLRPWTKTLPQKDAPEYSSYSKVPENFNNIPILCNRKTPVCKNVILDFKKRYSIPNEFQWISKAQDAQNAKLTLVCLKISRLVDDVADAIRVTDLLDDQTFFLIVIHTVEPGMDVDLSFPKMDRRILDVANLYYSESYGCYECRENMKAKSKLISWFSQPSSSFSDGLECFFKGLKR